MRRTMQVHLDRFDEALGKQGAALRRSQVQEVLASALGHLDSNHLAAAVKRGDLDVPVAEQVTDVTGSPLSVFRDPSTGMRFGLDPAWLGDRRDVDVVSPYGGIARLPDSRTQTPAVETVPLG